jgi:hypothetical protein
MCGFGVTANTPRCQRGNRGSIPPIHILLISIILCGSAYAERLFVEPLRPDEFGGRLGDIDCRIWSTPGYDWKNYRDDDKVTWAHEGTHSINSRMRNTMGVQNGYYLLDRQGIGLSNPKLTLKEIADAVPSDKRGRLYKLYMVDAQKWWNETPLYCVDELVAYINGSIVGVENEMDKRALDSYIRAVEMYGYCIVAYDLCKTRSYIDIDEFQDLLSVLQEKLVVLEETLKERGKKND